MSDQESNDSATKESQLLPVNNPSTNIVEAKTNDDQNFNDNNNDDANVGQEANVQPVDEEHQVIRSESVIKSPPKSSPSCIPVIRVVDTAAAQNTDTSSNEKSQENLSESGQMANTQSHSMSTNFLQTKSNITPTNPFLRATNFQSALNNECSDTDTTTAENQIIFAPPTLIPNLFSDKPKTDSSIANSEKSQTESNGKCL